SLCHRRGSMAGADSRQDLKRGRRGPRAPERAPAILGIVLGSAPKVETMTPCRRKRGKTGDGELAQLRAGRRRLRTAGRCRDDPETWSVRRTGRLRLDLARRSCGVSGLLQIAISL